MLKQQAKGEYETNIENQIAGQAISSSQVCVRELPVHGGIERRCAAWQSVVLQRNVRVTGVYG